MTAKTVIPRAVMERDGWTLTEENPSFDNKLTTAGMYINNYLLTKLLNNNAIREYTKEI